MNSSPYARTQKGRSVKIPTAASLAHAALFYLSRYAASESSLRRILKNRLRRTAMQSSAFAADLEQQALLQKAIEAIIESHKKSGALNDAAFAETKIHSLRRAGRSRRAIEQRLSHKGVAAPVIADMLQRSDDGDDPATADRKAALKLAQRRKLGRFRGESVPPDRLQKDLAIMARAGFSLAIARQVLGQSSSDDDFF